MEFLIAGKNQLRLIELDDLSKRVEWINNPTVNKYLNFTYPVSYAKTLNWFHSNITNQSRIDFSLLHENQYIGFCGILNIDRISRKSELYCTIGESQYWGKGIATEVYRLLVSYSFNILDLQKVWAKYNAGNSGAEKVFKKLNFKVEGNYKRDLFSRGEYVDRIKVALLR